MSTASQSGSRRIRISAAGEWWTLGGVGAFIACLYWATDAPLYNPVGFVDPWLYTALFVNFDWTYSTFWDTYYAARLPWVIPGYLLHSFLPTHVAYFVLHGCFFFGGGLFAYLLVRRYAGRVGALAAFTFLLGTQLYYIAQTWNYFDGAIVTYLLASFYFSLTRDKGRRRFVELALGGAFAAAAVLTNLFVVIFATGIPLLYLWLSRTQIARDRTRFEDTAAFAGGALALTFLCGVFSVVKGGVLLFWLPQLHAANRLVGSSAYEVHSWGWVAKDPRLWAPIFIALVAGVVCTRTGERHDLMWRFTIGSGVYIFASEAFMVIWDLAFAGSTLQTTYYFSLLLPSMTMCIGGVTGLLLRPLSARRQIHVALTASAVAVAAPLLLIYLDDERALTGRAGTLITAVLAAIALSLLAVALVRSLHRARAIFAVTAAAAALATPAFAIDSSADVFNYSRTDSKGDVYNLGTKLIAYLRESGVQGKRRFFFWYDGYDHGVANFRVGLQSLYFYALSFIGTNMPHVDRNFRARMKYFVPANGSLVLLCEDSACSGAPLALKRAGYRFASRSQRLLTAGREHVWVHVLAVKIGARS